MSGQLRPDATTGPAEVGALHPCPPVAKESGKVEDCKYIKYPKNRGHGAPAGLQLVSLPSSSIKAPDACLGGRLLVTSSFLLRDLSMFATDILLPKASANLQSLHAAVGSRSVDQSHKKSIDSVYKTHARQEHQREGA